MAQGDQVRGGQPAGVPVVGADQRHAAAGNRVQADRGHVTAEQFGDLCVLLDLGGGGDDPVDAPLDEGPDDVRAVRAAGGQVADQYRVPVPPRFLFRGDRRFGDADVRGVAGHQPDSGGGPLDERAGDRIGTVAELGGDGQDPLGGLRRDAHVTAVQHFARRLEADARAGRHLLERYVSSWCHRPASVQTRERTFAHNVNPPMYAVKGAIGACSRPRSLWAGAVVVCGGYSQQA
jgi:hypothetical protein